MHSPKTFGGNCARGCT